jgi:serine/threonine protein phosphatase 1
MSKTFVMGDIHGAYRALRQCLERSSFDSENDHLICLGDVCDGWPETKESIDELLKIRNLTYLLGNHDFWTLHWMMTGNAENVWLSQGGDATVKSYRGDGIPPVHVNFLNKALPYFLLNNKLFVHAGIDPQHTLEQQDLNTFLWDRDLAYNALDSYKKKSADKLTEFDEVYVGHTPIPFEKPIYSHGIWLMDTGAGWTGALSMMNINTKEIFMSDAVPHLYPGIEGRKPK